MRAKEMKKLLTVYINFKLLSALNETRREIKISRVEAFPYQRLERGRSKGGRFFINCES